jgi:hypothetical protein
MIGRRKVGRREIERLRHNQLLHRHNRTLREIEALNARIDDLVGLVTSQMPDDAFPCDEPIPACRYCGRQAHLNPIAHKPDCPLF